MRGDRNGGGRGGRGGRGRGGGGAAAEAPHFELRDGEVAKVATADGGAANGNGNAAPPPQARGGGADDGGEKKKRRRKKKTVPAIENYADASVQALMVGDRARTGAYHAAVMQNKSAFEGKTVLDVGAGQGILSMFAAKAGAKKVYAVERSKMARVARALVKDNNLEDVVEVLNEDLDLLELPEKVDVVISEWMGVGLVHERMLEVVLRARDRFLKEGGLVFPTTADLFVSPLVDDGAESELYAAHTWAKEEQYGIKWAAAQRLLPYHGPADGYVEGIGWALQRIIVPPSRVAAAAAVHHFDLRTCSVEDCKKFSMSLRFDGVAAPICGYALWFDVTFIGPDATVPLSTAPDCPPTHWRQLAWYFTEPLQTVPKGDDGSQTLTGELVAKANEKTAGYIFAIHDSLGNKLVGDTADFLWSESR